MEDWIIDLLDLQEVDMRIKRLKLRLTMIPEEQKHLTEKLDEEKENLHSTKKSFQKTELEIKQVESNIAQQNSEIERLQGQSAMVKKNEEYKALMSEIDHCNKKIGDFETQEILLLDKVEEFNKAYKGLEREFGLKESNIKDEIAELEELITEVNDEIKKINADRPAKEDKIDSSVLSIYSRMIPNRGIPLVSITNSICGNCHLKLTPQTLTQAKKRAVVHCDNCAHLVYIPE